jgi:hypothetical protein
MSPEVWDCLESNRWAKPPSRSRLNGPRSRVERLETVLLPGMQVRAFSECDQKSGLARQPVPPAKAREPYDNELVKRWTAEITETTVTQRELSIGSVCLARKWIANCKPIDRLAVSHALRVKCAGASMERSRDDE